ncbi:MAG: carboxypeptidase-like regulatory domain-containing protein, partial [Candidatus Bathyarchaeota archaeon]
DQFDHGWIVGKVIDGETTLPIANASVIAGSETANTQANGYYLISNVPSGNQTITASALGYIAESKQIYQSSGVTTTVNFELIAGGAIDGTVTDEATGHPIDGASIILNGHITSTNSEGYYNISDIAPGNYTVSVAATGYMSDSKPVRIDPHITTSANFTLLPAGNLSITTAPVSGEVFVNGTSWGNSPKSEVVTVGQYNITFGPVTGYLTPSWQLAVVQQGVDTTVEGVYDPITGTLTITTTPVNAEVFVNGTSWGTAPQSRTVQIGTYIITFGDEADYQTPSEQTAIINENLETEIEGEYESVPISLWTLVLAGGIITAIVIAAIIMIERHRRKPQDSES